MQARRLRAADAQGWKTLRLEALATYPNAFLTTHAEAAATPLARVAERLEAGHTYGAFAASGMLGIASLIPQTRTQTRHRAEIGAFFVQPKAQGAGAADALMHALIAAGSALGVWQFELFVAQDNARAIAFYRRHGFAKAGRMPNATYDCNGAVHDLIMVRSAPPA
ncbi:MAG: N-acetyltransferase [Pseudomonadota bacterium]